MGFTEKNLLPKQENSTSTAGPELGPKEPFRFEGDITVLDSFLQGAQGKEEGKRRLIFCPGGGFRPHAGQALLALLEAGGKDGTEHVVSISTGTASAAHFLGNEPSKNARMYKLSTKEGLFKKNVGPITFISSSVIGDVARGEIGSLAVNTKNILEGPTDFNVQVTDMETGEAVWIDAKKHPEMIDVFVASTAVPTPNQLNIKLDGKRVTDGSIGDPFPIQKIVETFKPTDVLILSSVYEDENKHTDFSAMTKAYLKLALPRKTADKALKNQETFEEELRWLRKQNDFRWLMTFATEDMDMLNIPKKKMFSLLKETKQQFANELEKAKERIEARENQPS